MEKSSPKYDLEAGSSFLCILERGRGIVTFLGYEEDKLKFNIMRYDGITSLWKITRDEWNSLIDEGDMTYLGKLYG